MLYDPFGREITSLPTKPDTGEFGAVRLRDTWSSYPAKGLTPEKLAGILREADQGDVERQAELYEDMEERDLDLAGAFQTRKLAVSGLEREVIAASDSAEDKKIADHVRENLDDLDIDDIILDLMDAVAKGFAWSELIWTDKSGKAWVECVEWMHQKRARFHDLTAADYSAKLPKVPYLLTDGEPLRGEEIAPFKVIYHRYKARSGFASRGGLMRPCTWYYLFKNYDLKDWVVFVEKFGQPLRIGKYMPGAAKEDIDTLKQAIRDLGTDAGAVISDQTLIDIIDQKGTTAANVHEPLAKYVDRAYAKGILGQTASSEGTPGKLGNEDAQSEVRQDLLEADAKALARTIRFQLIWPMVGFNFGWDKSLPTLRFSVEESEDLTARVQVDGALVDMGVPIPLDFVRKKYGIPEPKPGEEILQVQQAAAADDGDVGATGGRPSARGFAAMHAPSFKKKVLVPIGSRSVKMQA